MRIFETGSVPCVPNTPIAFAPDDVDESILLADRILLMTNGPYAKVAESVKVDIERPRDRTTIIHDPGYYPIRNHLVDFLVKRSKELAGGPGDSASPGDTSTSEIYTGFPPEVNPAKDAIYLSSA